MIRSVVLFVASIGSRLTRRHVRSISGGTSGLLRCRCNSLINSSIVSASYSIPSERNLPNSSHARLHLLLSQWAIHIRCLGSPKRAQTAAWRFSGVNVGNSIGQIWLSRWSHLWLTSTPCLTRRHQIAWIGSDGCLKDSHAQEKWGATSQRTTLLLEGSPTTAPYGPETGYCKYSQQHRSNSGAFGSPSARTRRSGCPVSLPFAWPDGWYYFPG